MQVFMSESLYEDMNISGKKSCAVSSRKCVHKDLSEREIEREREREIAN